MDLKAKIRSIENYPQEGIIFRDITTLLKDAEGMKAAIDEMQAKVSGYLEVLFNADPKSVGGTLHDDAFYYFE